MNSTQLRAAVQAFRDSSGHGQSTPHCFAPWYLHKHLELPVVQAIAQSSDGNYDFGLDAFHLQEGTPPVLILVQAKFTGSVGLLSKGYADLERSLGELSRRIEGIATEAPVQNGVLVNLHARLNQLSHDSRKTLKLEFHLLHVSDIESTLLRERVRPARERLKEALEDALPDHVSRLREVGPRDLGHDEVVVVPSKHDLLTLNNLQEFSAGPDARMFTGVGRLADLVGLYAYRRDHLFSKNVRFYLHSKKNTEKGPAAKMRETLKQLCVESKGEPEQFALYHNGVTIHAAGVRIEDGRLSVRDPFVLNGCQTIKNAYFFLNDVRLKGRIDQEKWKRIAVPIRVVETRSDELVRTITVNNNRQNQISVAALRANDPVQLRLQERFRLRKIFYQRQEGAFSALEGDRPEQFEEEYYNTRNSYVEIEELARVIAAASGEIGLSEHPGELFESDSAYNRFFNEKKKLTSIAFLTFLQNLYSVIGVVLTKDLDLVQEGAGPRPSKLKAYALCLIPRFLARENKHAVIEQYGEFVLDHDKNWRAFVEKIMRSKKSGIRDAFARHFIKLPNTEQSAMTEAFEEIQRTLGLKKELDPFDVFKDVGERGTPEEEEDEVFGTNDLEQ